MKRSKSFYRTKFVNVNTEVILTQVGPDWDSYSLHSLYEHDLETNAITCNCKVIKNELHPTKTSEDQQGSYREVVFTGTIIECRDYINNIYNEERKRAI